MLKVAIVGAGPGGFYAADALLRQDVHLEVSLIERLPIPYGLVRNGVAPDHPSLKQVCRLFERTGENPRVEFLGNTELGRHVSLGELRRIYHAVVLAIGADSDRPLDLPGDNADCVYTASEIVGWYNSHPDHAHVSPDFGRGRVCIFGHGNVAADIARVLLSAPERLHKTDISANALAALARFPVREIHLIGRRGAADTRFSAPVLSELVTLPGVKTVIGAPIDPATYLPDSSRSMSTQENLRIFQDAANRDGTTADRALHFHFNCNLSSLQRECDFLRIQLEHAAVEPLELQVDVAVTAIGFCLKELHDVSLHVKEGSLANQRGRLLDRQGRRVPGGYVVGWAARGASGTIGACRSEAERLAQVILSDAPALSRYPARGYPALRASLAAKGHSPVTFKQWKRLDHLERAGGAAIGRPRLKMRSVQQMLASLEQNTANKTDIRQNA